MDPEQQKKMVDDILKADPAIQKLTARGPEQEIAEKLDRMDREVAHFVRAAVAARGFVSPEIRLKTTQLYLDRMDQFTSTELATLMATFLATALCYKFQ